MNADDPSALAAPSAASADSSPTASATRRTLTPDLLIEAWSGIALRTGALLRDTWSADTEARLRRIDAELIELVASEPNGSLLWLVHHNIGEPQNYSVLHSLLVAVVCELAADYLGPVSADIRASTRLAALTMNLTITRLQDELVRQTTPLTDEQRDALRDHGAQAAALLAESGVGDPLWLEALEHHHNAPPGALAGLAPEMQIARLIQQADVFAARLSPRAVRTALAANDAAKGIYFDERKTPDEAGGAIIKAVGIDVPGSPVLLRNGEVAVVVRRGQLANQPVVACIATAQGMPVSMPQLRDCRQPEHAVVSGLPPHRLRVRVVLGQLLRLGRQSAA